MALGTPTEIQEQICRVNDAEQVLMAAKLRLRALRGEPLMQSGDRMNVLELGDTLTALQNEFGARNLQMF